MNRGSAFTIISSLCLAACSPKNTEPDAAGVADSVLADAAVVSATVAVQLVGYTHGRYDVMIRATLDEGLSQYDSKDVEFLTNGKKMEFSTSTGNYYEPNSAFRVAFDENSDLGDTLKFAIQLRDSITLPAGHLHIKPLMDFLNTKDLYRDINPEPEKPLRINWGGPHPDSLTVSWVVTNVSDDGQKTSSSWLAQQGWNESHPVIIAPEYFQAPDEVETAVYITWWKEGRGHTEIEGVRSSIGATAKVTQTIKSVAAR